MKVFYSLIRFRVVISENFKTASQILMFRFHIKGQMILINIRLLEINVLAICALVKSPGTERPIDCIITGLRSNMIVPDWITST